VYLFAAPHETGRDSSVDWHELLLGRPPDFLPNDDDADLSTNGLHTAVDHP
jgi:hypothetical protein